MIVLHLYFYDSVIVFYLSLSLTLTLTQATFSRMVPPYKLGPAQGFFLLHTHTDTHRHTHTDICIYLYIYIYIYIYIYFLNISTLWVVCVSSSTSGHLPEAWEFEGSAQYLSCAWHSSSNSSKCTEAYTPSPMSRDSTRAR